jgi:hypothetical protein
VFGGEGGEDGIYGGGDYGDREELQWLIEEGRIEEKKKGRGRWWMQGRSMIMIN